MSAIEAGRGSVALSREDEANAFRAMAFDFWQWRYLILGCGALGLLVAFAYSVSIRPSYEASARLMIQRGRPDLTPGTEVTLTPITNEWIQTQLQLMRGRETGVRALTKFQGEPRQRLARELAAGPIRSWFEIARSKLGFAPPLSPETSSPGELAPEAFLARMSIGMVPASNLLQVSFRAYDPWLTAEAANALAQTFVEANIAEQRSVTAGAVTWIDGQLQEQRDRVRTAQDALRQYEKSVGLTNIEEQRRLAASRVEAARGAQLWEATRARASKEAQLTQLLAMTSAEIAGLPEAQRSPTLAAVVREIGDLESRRSSMSLELGERHPDLLSIDARLKTLSGRLAAETRGIIRQAETEFRAAQREVASLEEAARIAETKLTELSVRAEEYTRLKNSAEAEGRLAEGLANQGRQTRLESAISDSVVRIVEPARQPISPSFPNRTRNVQTGTLLGLAVGVAVVLGLRRLDQTFQGTEDVRATLGVNVLAAIPAVDAGLAARAPGTLGQSPQGFAFEESFSVLRTSVLVAASDRKHKVFLLSSAGPGEGKSTVAHRLADSLARLGKNTLLIDADLRRPTLHKRLGIALSPGLSEVLSGSAPVERATRVVTPTLGILPAGQLPGNPADLVAGPAFRALTAAARTHYDLVIIDGPPTLGMTDSLAMLAATDYLMVVVSCGQTPASAAREMSRQVEALGYRIDGVIVNRVDARRHAYSYAYSYSYKTPYAAPRPGGRTSRA